MDPRPQRMRLAAAAVATVTLLLLAGCANDPDNYPHAGEHEQTLLRSVLIYVVAPLLISGLIAAAVFLPSARHSQRYRPQAGWDADPVWFAGPPDPVAAVEQAHDDSSVRGGAGGSW